MTHKHHHSPGFASQLPKMAQVPKAEEMDRLKAAETLSRLRAFRVRGGLSDSDWKKELKRFGFELKSNGKMTSHNLDIYFGDAPVRDPTTSKVMTVENRNARGAGLGISYMNTSIKALIRYMEISSQQ